MAPSLVTTLVVALEIVATILYLVLIALSIWLIYSGMTFRRQILPEKKSLLTKLTPFILVDEVYLTEAGVRQRRRMLKGLGAALAVLVLLGIVTVWLSALPNPTWSK